MIRAEAGILSYFVSEAAKQEGRDGEQHERNSNLSGDEKVALVLTSVDEASPDPPASA